MEYQNVLTTCCYCGTGCTFFLQVLDGEVVGVLPNREHPVSLGRLCLKGWNAAAHVSHEDRLKTPLVRRNGALEPAAWDEALDLVATRLNALRDTHGPDAVAYLASAKCTNEENYLLQKLARAVGKTNNIDHCARL